MKNLLPNRKSFTNFSYTLSSIQSKKTSGFTLVELMVVISIIAILAVIGVTVFSGAQGQARDGQRLSEINSLGKAIEAAKDPTQSIVLPSAVNSPITGPYRYDSSVFKADFPSGSGIQDPQSSKREYCLVTTKNLTTAFVAGDTVAIPLTAVSNTVVAATGCPTFSASGLKFDFDSAIVLNKGASFTAFANKAAFLLCSPSERGSAPICYSSLAR